MAKERSVRAFAVLLLLATSVPDFAQEAEDQTKGVVVEQRSEEKSGHGGMKASVLLEDSNRAGSMRQVNPNRTFYSGDRFRIQLESKREGYVYLLLEDSRGDRQLLYPFSNDRDKDNFIRSQENRIVPDQTWFRFDDNPGKERVYLVVADQPIVDLDRLAGEPDARISQELFHGIVDRNDSKGIGIDNTQDSRFPPRNTLLLSLNHSR